MKTLLLIILGFLSFYIALVSFIAELIERFGCGMPQMSSDPLAGSGWFFKHGAYYDHKKGLMVPTISKNEAYYELLLEKSIPIANNIIIILVFGIFLYNVW